MSFLVGVKNIAVCRIQIIFNWLDKLQCAQSLCTPQKIKLAFQFPFCSLPHCKIRKCKSFSRSTHQRSKVRECNPSSTVFESDTLPTLRFSKRGVLQIYWILYLTLLLSHFLRSPFDFRKFLTAGLIFQNCPEMQRPSETILFGNHKSCTFSRSRWMGSKVCILWEIGLKLKLEKVSQISLASDTFKVKHWKLQALLQTFSGE